MHEGYVDWRVGRTWYRVVGEGGSTPLLCLHGAVLQAFFAETEGAQRG